MFASGSAGSARRVGARLLSAACIIAVVSAQSPVHAQAVGQKASIAEGLFNDGKRLIEQGKIAEGCIKLADSQRTDPALGTLLYLADCHERDGKTASAWAEFTDAATQARTRLEHDREKFANAHATALEKKLHRLQIDATEKYPGLAITLDNESFGVGGLGTAIPLDPGEHQIAATATGKKPWSTKLTLNASPGVDRVNIPFLENEPVPVAPVAPAPKVGSDVHHEEGAPADTTKRTVGIVVGVAGVGLLGLATYYELTAVSRDKDSQDATRAHEDQVTLNDQAKKAQTFAFISGGAGIVALGVGIFLIATSGGSSAPVKAAQSTVRLLPMASLNTGGLRVVGSW